MTSWIDRTFTVAFAIGLTACGTPGAIIATPVQSPAVVAPTLTAAPTPISASVPFNRSILVAYLDLQTDRMVLAAVDPNTGNRLAGNALVDLGAKFDYCFTPDGHTLIFTKYVSPNPSRGELRFLDLSTWKDNFAILLLSAQATTALALSPDRSKLAVAFAQADGGSLWLVDTERRVVLAETPTQALISTLKFTSDGLGLMEYERQRGSNGAPGEGPPAVARRSTHDLATEWFRSLSSVSDGFVPDPSAAGNPQESGAGSIFMPATVFAPDKDILYILHADVPRLTRVDFGRQSVLTLDIRPRLSWFEGLLMASSTTVHAKAQNGIQLQARISPDGTMVYFDGLQTTVTEQTRGTWVEMLTPLNLQAIRLKDASQVYQSTVTGGSLDLSADGTRLLVPQTDSVAGAVTGTSELDASTGYATGRYQNLSLRFGTLIDGTPILLSSTPGVSDPASTQMTAMTPGHILLGSWAPPANAEWLIKP